MNADKPVSGRDGPRPFIDGNDHYHPEAIIFYAFVLFVGCGMGVVLMLVVELILRHLNA